LADNSLDGVECTAYYPGSGSVADIVLVTPLLSIKKNFKILNGQ